MGGNTTERLHIVPIFVSFSQSSTFWNGTVLFEEFLRERKPWAFHLLNGTIGLWNEKTALPCERGPLYVLGPVYVIPFSFHTEIGFLRMKLSWPKC